MDGVLDHAGCDGEIEHVHGLVIVQHGVDEAAGEGVAAADAVQDVEGEQPAFKGMVVIPHEGLQAVLRAGMRVAHVARDAADIRVLLHEVLEDLVLLLVGGLQGDVVFPVAFGGISVVAIEMIGFDAEQDVDIGQAFGAEVAGFFPGPEGGAEVAVKADGQAELLGGFKHPQDRVCAGGTQSGRDAAQVQPVEFLEQGFEIISAEIVFRDSGMLAVIDDLAGADAVAGLEIISAQAMGRRLLRAGEDHRRAVHVVGTQPAHSAFAQRVVGHDGEKRAVYLQVGQRERDIGFAAAVAGFKSVCHADLVIVGRGQPQHDFTHGDEPFTGGLQGCQWILMLHGYTS